MKIADNVTAIYAGCYYINDDEYYDSVESTKYNTLFYLAINHMRPLKDEEFYNGLTYDDEKKVWEAEIWHDDGSIYYIEVDQNIFK